jgi:hypothetical protein
LIFWMWMKLQCEMKLLKNLFWFCSSNIIRNFFDLLDANETRMALSRLLHIGNCCWTCSRSEIVSFQFLILFISFRLKFLTFAIIFYKKVHYIRNYNIKIRMNNLIHKIIFFEMIKSKFPSITMSQPRF